MSKPQTSKTRAAVKMIRCDHEEVLRAHALLDGITRGTDDMIAALDKDFGFLFFNDAYRREFKRLWDVDIEIGANIVDAMARYPQEQQKAKELWGRAIKGESFSITTEFGPSEAAQQVYDLRFNPINDPQGRPIGAAHIIRNVTEQARTERALRRSEERYNLVNQATNDIIWDWDLTNNRLHWSEAVEPAVGRSREQMPETIQSWYEHIHPEDRDRVTAGIHRAIDGGEKTWSDEYRFGPIDGPWRIYLDRGLIARDESKTPYRMIGSMLDITSQRQAEEALLESASFYRQTLESIPGMVFTTRPDGYCDYQSRQWVDYTGVPMSEQLGDGWNKLLHPDDRPRAYAAWQAAVEDVAPYDLEYRVRRHDGQYEWFRVIGQPIRDAAGHIVRWFGVIMNIEALKHAEEALRKTESRLNAALDHLGEGVVIATEAGEVIYWNPAARAMYGLSDDEDILRPLASFADTFQLWTPDGNRMLSLDEWPMARILAGESIHNLELRIRRPEHGWERINLYSGTMVETAAGERLIYLSIFDITEQRQTEQHLRSVEQQRRAALESAQMGTWDVDIATQTVHWDERCRALFAMPDRPVVPLAEPVSRMHPDDRPGAEGDIAAAMAGKNDGRYDVEYRVLWPDGQVRWVRATGQTLFEGDLPSQRPLRFVGVIMDITERKQGEESLRRLNESLEQGVRERTAELSLKNRQLQQRAEQLSHFASALTLAEQRERHRLAKVLHDHLQQLLVAARFGLEGLADSIDNETNETLREIQDLINESIAASRSLTVELSPTILHEAGLAAGLEWLARWMKQKHGLTVQIDTRKDAATDREDMRILLFESVRELLFNVVKHAATDRAKVTLARADALLEIAVSDEGAGFDPQRVAEGERMTGGFGLFSIRERLELLGGSLHIESAPGRGSRFVLTAPALYPSEEVVVEMQRKRIAAEQEEAAIEAGGTPVLRVLIVDDHKVLRQSMAARLRREPDIEIAGEAGDGFEATEKAHLLRPHVILMDYSMPRMDGVEATRRICHELPNTRIIGLSMYEEADRANAMLEAGAATYVTKSAEFDELLAAIRTAPAQSH
ncbi:MAG: PAS domain-containing protein [Phycisphaerae bacterium]|nr:PAS domain-containing protein [Phycisphaerae bacterium]